MLRPAIRSRGIIRLDSFKKRLSRIQMLHHSSQKFEIDISWVLEYSTYLLEFDFELK